MRRYQKTDQKIGIVIRQSTPQEKKPMLTEERVEKIKTISGTALVIIGVAGVIALSAIAPNIFIAIDKLFLKKSPNRRLSKKEKDIKVAKIFYYLKRSGQIKMKLTKNDFVISLTRLGKKKYDKSAIDTLIVPKPKSWDGKWWQVAADIPTEDYKWAADLFRNKLKEMKFYPLQRTLWFYPHDPRREIEFLIRYYGLLQFVTAMEINRLDKDDEAVMKSYFKKEGIL